MPPRHLGGRPGEWRLDNDFLFDNYFPEREIGGEWLNVVLWRLEDVMCLTKSPNIAFEVALCYCLLRENAPDYDRICSEQSEHEAIYTVVTECDGLVADLILCEPAAVRVEEKRRPSPRYYMAAYQSDVCSALKQYNRLYPKHLTKSALKQ